MNSLSLAANALRFLCVDGVEQAKSGHPGAPMGLSEIATVVFTKFLRFDPAVPNWPNRDRFVLSCGHASMLLYSVLHLAGYRVTLDDLKSFRQWGSRTPGHPEHGWTEGVETTSGPLGQGFANAVGMALAAKMAQARFGDGSGALIDYRVFVLASDGDLMEGVTGEAASLAGHWGLDNLVVVYDDNGITIDGSTELALSENVPALFEARGWSVERVDGHDIDAVQGALSRATVQAQKPHLIVAKTQIGHGAPNKQNRSVCHGSPLGAAEATLAKQAAGWPLTPTFHVPAEAYGPFRERAEQGRQMRVAWEARVAALPDDMRSAWQRQLDRNPPPDLLAKLLEAAKGPTDATRKLSQRIEKKVAELLPRLVGGSADLDASVMTALPDTGYVSRDSFQGRNIHFGIREHAMGSIANGLALSGMFLPFTGTFHVFSDYMRPPVRLAALMEQQVLFIFTHDSIYVGEDGPTHQPIEQTASLRLIPNVHVVRPADAQECAAVWAYAVTRQKGPTVFVLTRQTLPELQRPQGFEPSLMLRGAYVLSPAPKPELVLVATGSEVGLAVDAAKLLSQEGRRIAVVSAPCWEAFQAQSEEYKAQVLPPGIPRIVLELGVTSPWQGVVQPNGMVIGLDRFGASAPFERLQKEFGFDAAQVAEQIRRFLSGRAS